MADATEARLLVRVEATQAKMEKQMAAIAASAARQAKATEDSFKSANDNIGKSFQKGSKAAVQSLGAQRAAVSNLSFQLNDIAMGLASGTSPFTIMVQQGSQVSQVLQGSGGLVGAVKTLGGAFTQMVNPVSLASFALIGLAGIAVQYFTKMLGDSSEAEETLKEQAKLIDKVAEKWGDALPALKKYNDERKRLADESDIKTASEAVAQGEFTNIRKVIGNVRAEIGALVIDLKGAGAEDNDVIRLQKAFNTLFEQVETGHADIEQLRKVQDALNTLFQNTGVPAVDAMAKSVGGLADELERAIDAASSTRFQSAIRDFYKQNPLGTLTPLQSGGGQFLNPDQMNTFNANQGDLQAAGSSAAAQLIKGFEGFITNAKWDKNAFRVGFGSDTTTRANGQIEKVTKDTVVTIDDAQRDLSRRILEFQSGIQKAIGIDTWKSLSDAQQAALTSIAYNYGSLPKSIVAAIEGGGGPEIVAKAIASLTANPDRRKQEAETFLSGTGISMSDAGLTPSKKKTPDDIFAGNIAQVQKRIDVLNAEYAAQAKLNPLIDDYGYAVEKARIEQQLLSDAQKAGLTITPDLAAKIGTLAENYAKTTAASGILTEKNQKLAESMQAASSFGKDLLGGFISDLQNGKSASEALAGALSKVGDKLLEISLNALFDGNKPGSGGGLLGGIFGSIGKVLGFDEGGYTGPGGKNQPAGVVHKGEYVFDKRATDRIGVKNLARLQKGYASGGFVGAATPTISAPSIPQSRQPQAGIAGVKVYVDENGNWQAKVMGIARQEAAGVTRTGISQYDRQLDRSFGSRMSRAQGRQL